MKDNVTDTKMSDIVLQTERLVLRQFELTDLDACHVYGSDPEVVKYMHFGPNTKDQTLEFLRDCQKWRSETPRKTFEFAITLKESNYVIGGCGMRIKSAQNKVADLGYTLRRDQWGKGIGTEAAQVLLEFGFETLGMHRIWATASPENLQSRKILEKIGMQFEGILREDMLIRGEYRDSALYAILEQEWRSKSP